MDQFEDISVISNSDQLEYDFCLFENGANRDLFTPPRDPVAAAMDVAMGSTMEHSEALDESNNNYGLVPQSPSDEWMPIGFDFISITTTPSAVDISAPTNLAEDGTPLTPIATDTPTPGTSTGGAPNPGSRKKRKRKEPVHKKKVADLRAQIEEQKREVEEINRNTLEYDRRFMEAKRKIVNEFNRIALREIQVDPARDAAEKLIKATKYPSVEEALIEKKNKPEGIGIKRYRAAVLRKKTNQEIIPEREGIDANAESLKDETTGIVSRLNDLHKEMTEESLTLGEITEILMKDFPHYCTNDQGSINS